MRFERSGAWNVSVYASRSRSGPASPRAAALMRIFARRTGRRGWDASSFMSARGVEGEPGLDHPVHESVRHPIERRSTEFASSTNHCKRVIGS
jgi:hypothetical protein